MKRPGMSSLPICSGATVAVLAVCGLGASAQVYNPITGCYGDTAGIAPEVCFNHPNAPPTQPPPPDGPYASIAASLTTFVVGASYFESSQADADRDAVKSCIQNHGGTGCKVVTRTRKRCIGVATSPADGATGWSGAVDTRLEAWNNALAQCRKSGGRNCKVMTTPCAGDTWQWSPQLPLPPAPRAANLDARTVGTWTLDTPAGHWIWEIGDGGTYEFHAETQQVYEPSHAGRFAAANGKWSLEATAGGFVDVDGGTYAFQGPNVMNMTGKYGVGIWRRIK
jgi:Domain of unknown function (DUF4189)